MLARTALAALLAASALGGACATAPAAGPPPSEARTLRAHSPTRARVKTPGPPHGAEAPDLSAVKWFRGAPPAAGQGYLLFFWGTWCKPCKAVLPQTMAYAEGRGLPLVAISRDDPELLEAFVAGWEAPFPERIAYEHPAYPLHKAYGAFSVPRLVEVAPDGTIAMVHYGVIDLKHVDQAVTAP